MGLVRALLVAALVWLAAAPGSAQEASAAEARALFEGAVQAIEEGRFSDAVTALRRSLALEPRAPTAFNLAVALRGVGEARESRALFDRLLAGEFGPLPEARRAQVQPLRDEVAAEVAQLQVTVEGPDAPTLTVDGAEVAPSEPRAFALELDPGEHVVRATAVDWEPAQRELELSPGESRALSITLRPAVDDREGVLVLDCDEDDAVAEIVDVGSGPPPLQRSLAPGTYAVRCHAGDRSRESTVDVPAGRRVRLALDVPSPSLAESPWLWVGVGAGVAAAAGVLIWALTQLEAPPITHPHWGNIPIVE